MSDRGEHGFTTTTLFIVGSLLLWMANFVVVYVFAAVACARGFADLRALSVPIVPFVTILTSLATAVITVVLLRRGLALLRTAAASDHARFIGFIAFMTSVLAIVALALLALPPLAVSACAR